MTVTCVKYGAVLFLHTFLISMYGAYISELLINQPFIEAWKILLINY